MLKGSVMWRWTERFLYDGVVGTNRALKGFTSREQHVMFFFYISQITYMWFPLLKLEVLEVFLLQRHRWGREANTHTHSNQSVNKWVQKNPKSFSVKWQNISFCTSVMIITGFFTLRYVFRNFTLELVTFSGTHHRNQGLNLVLGNLFGGCNFQKNWGCSTAFPWSFPIGRAITAFSFTGNMFLVLLMEKYPLSAPHLVSFHCPPARDQQPTWYIFGVYPSWTGSNKVGVYLWVLEAERYWSSGLTGALRFSRAANHRQLIMYTTQIKRWVGREEQRNHRVG